MHCMFLIGFSFSLHFLRKGVVAKNSSCITCQSLISYIHQERHRCLELSNLKNLLKLSIPKDVCLMPEKHIFIKAKQFEAEPLFDYKSILLSYVSYFSEKLTSLLQFSNACLLCSKQKKVTSAYCNNPFHTNMFIKLVYGSSVKYNFKDSMCYIPQKVKSSNLVKEHSIKLQIFSPNNSVLNISTWDGNFMNCPKPLIQRKKDFLSIFTLPSSFDYSDSAIKFKVGVHKIIQNKTSFLTKSCVFDKQFTYLTNESCNLFEIQNATLPNLQNNTKSVINGYKKFMMNLKFETVQINLIQTNKSLDKITPNSCANPNVLLPWSGRDLKNFSFSSNKNFFSSPINRNWHLFFTNLQSFKLDDKCIFQQKPSTTDIAKVNAKNTSELFKNCSLFSKSLLVAVKSPLRRFVDKITCRMKTFSQNSRNSCTQAIYRRKLTSGDVIDGFFFVMLLHFTLICMKINPVKRFYEETLREPRFEPENLFRDTNTTERPSWRNFELELLVALVEISNLVPAEAYDLVHFSLDTQKK